MDHRDREVVVVELEIGVFTGTLRGGKPNGEGALTFKAGGGRKEYRGQWADGMMAGRGTMTFLNGDVYEGDFLEGLPHGRGRFQYAETGDVEDSLWDSGRRHGVSLYRSVVDGTEEEVLFWEGVPDGPAVLRDLKDGSVEERVYCRGTKEGPALRRSRDGTETFEFNYVQDQVQGQATHTSREEASAKGKTTTVQERCGYQNGVKHGPSVVEKLQEDGGRQVEREERSYVDGVLQGPAVLLGQTTGGGGDKLEFSYKDGKRCGPATYTWADGSVETTTYDGQGVETGPARLVWPNGAIREGRKVGGLWHGRVIYTYALEGPRKGRQDCEIWEDGQMVSTKKMYGSKSDGASSSLTVKTWEDLGKLDDQLSSMPIVVDARRSGSKADPAAEEIFYDCES